MQFDERIQPVFVYNNNKNIKILCLVINKKKKTFYNQC